MILVLSGTRDGREIIRLLREKGYPVLATATTPYGARLASEAGASAALERQLGSEDMLNLLKERGVRAVVDATHPFAQKASRNGMLACKKAGIRYLRFERKSETLPESTLLHRCKSFDEGAAEAVAMGEVIFCAIGSNHLNSFIEAARKEKKRIIAKVLPTHEALDKCAALGLELKDIVALQGPGSMELNKALLRDYKAKVLVTKESGATGGEDVKVRAALSLGLPTVLIARPRVEYPLVAEEYEDVLRWLEEEK
ncbi:MAG: precorrin-6A reductase [Candidatus Hydrothermarchaeota archaeon]|nr:precorrin-6A reductase [Candidatus Hydrothermarchaeota archaeon]MDP6613033.1 precorrin-6A reductase [Candidatus Hydrothermarchaeota archaeon]